MKDTILLCTFTDINSLDSTIQQIKSKYTLAMGSIYVLQNEEDPNQLILTYNIIGTQVNTVSDKSYTISAHRKKKTNTIYTINAINKMIIEKIGHLDVSHSIDWSELQNMVIVTAYGKLKKIKTSIFDIIKV